MRANLRSHGQPTPESNDLQPKIRHSATQQVIEQLEGFELGQFLLANRGLNGFWTSYLINYPSRRAEVRKQLSELELFILERAPIVLATQERYEIVRELIQSKCRNSMKLASIPSGMMDDLLSLNYQDFSQIELTGVDLDQENLDLARRTASVRQPRIPVSFECKDAWNLESPRRWDLISSNGLNIYVENDQECTDLYRSFGSSLTPGGLLVTSFITPPSTWLPHAPADLVRQKLIFSDAIGAKWQCLRSEELTCRQLTSAGFQIEEIRYDSQRMFPTVMARRV